MMCFDFHSVSLAMRAPYLWCARSCVDVEKVQRKSVKEMAKTWVNVWYLGMFEEGKQPERLFTSKIPLHRNEMKVDDSRWTWKKEFSIFNFFDSFFFPLVGRVISIPKLASLLMIDNESWPRNSFRVLCLRFAWRRPQHTSNVMPWHQQSVLSSFDVLRK